MSDSANTLQATVEDYFSDDDDDDTTASLSRKPTNTAPRQRSRSKPPPSFRNNTAPDTESVDSGYSSKTAATQNSRDSAHASRKARPINSNANPVASLPRPRSSSTDPKAFSKPDSQRNPFAVPPPPPPPPPPQGNKGPPSRSAMQGSSHCQYPDCRRCLAERFERLNPIGRGPEGQYAPFLPHPTAIYHSQQQSPANVSFPPSSFVSAPAAPLPRRAYSGGPSRPRPRSYHEQMHMHQSPTISVGYPPMDMGGETFYRPATAASGSAYLPPRAPPLQSYAQPIPSPTSQRRFPRPQITHYETEPPATARPRSMHGSAMVSHLYGTPRSQFLPPPQGDRRRRSTSPVIRGGHYDDDRDLMPPPAMPRSTPAELSRAPSARRRRESEARPIYADDGYSDEGRDPYETIRPTRPGPPRPSILPEQLPKHYYPSSAVPSRQSFDTVRNGRASYIGQEELAARTTDAEAHMARTSRSTQDPLTAEAVKRVNRRSVDSGSRSHKSRSHDRGSSERDGPSSHVSKAGTRLQIRAGEDDSWEVEGDMAGHSIRLIPQEGGGRPQIIIDAGSGRETRYHRDGSKTSKTSNRSFASRAGRTGRASDPDKAGRRSSTTGQD